MLYYVVAFSKSQKIVACPALILNAWQVAPGVHRHLKQQSIEPILYMTEWFLCIFTRNTMLAFANHECKKGSLRNYEYDHANGNEQKLAYDCANEDYYA